MSEAILKDENNDHKYFCILQNILSHIGLTAFERSLYWAIKEACGEGGECTKSYDTLCKISGMGITKLKETIIKLKSVNPIIGKPLIIVTQRISPEGDKATNKIVVVDLWTENFKHFQKSMGQSPRDPPPSPRDQGVSRHATEGQSPRDYKEEPLNKNPLNKIPPPPAPQKKEVGDEDKLKILKLISECKEKGLPFSEAAIYAIFKETCGLSIQNTIHKYLKRSKNLKPLDTPDAWLRKNAIQQHEYLLQKKDYEI